jgi:hypothetical protein
VKPNAIIPTNRIIAPWTMPIIAPARRLVGWCAIASMLNAAAPTRASPAARSPFLVSVMVTPAWTFRHIGWRQGPCLASRRGA